MNTRPSIALVAACLAVAALDCKAQHVIGLHLATAHFGADLKAETPGLYARHASGATAGAYRNSYGQWSTYFGWSWESPGRAVALTVGAVTGYPATRVMPLLVPSARMALARGTAARLSFIPKPMRHGTAAGLHVSVEQEF